MARMDEAARALATAPWPAAFVNTLVREVDTLMPEPGARFAVRSSAKIEDKAGALAAGLFGSRVDVARGEVLGAMREVLGSALAPAVIAYLAQHGLGTDALGFAVLIHPYIVGQAAGAAAFDPAASDTPIVEVHTGDPALFEEATQKQLIEAVRKLAASFGPVEVEWSANGREITYLQLRPYRAPVRVLAGGGLGAAASYAPGRQSSESSGIDDWRWDAAHNPMPLSPAQAGLVDLVDARCRTGLHQRVVGGYLFYATDPTSEDRPDRSRRSAARAVRIGGRTARPSDADTRGSARNVPGHLPAAVRRRPTQRAGRARWAGRFPEAPRIRSGSADAQAAGGCPVGRDRPAQTRPRAGDGRGWRDDARPR